MFVCGKYKVHFISVSQKQRNLWDRWAGHEVQVSFLFATLVENNVLVNK
jgi:hypothetical protein